MRVAFLMRQNQHFLPDRKTFSVRVFVSSGQQTAQFVVEATAAFRSAMIHAVFHRMPAWSGRRNFRHTNGMKYRK
jgi:hypothetical protein